MKRIPSKVLSQPMSIITPISINNESKNSESDKPPRLSPQISVVSSIARAPSPSLSRSRLQLKPATSPKLNIEQYLTVSNTDISKLVSKSEQIHQIGTGKTRRSGVLTETGVATSDHIKIKGAQSGSSSVNSVTSSSSSPQLQDSKKPKRESLSKKTSAPVLIPWSKRNKEPPKKSGGWSWKGEGFVAKVYLNVS